ncbi:MAG TPA: universal stress protein, partial [Acidimicrobiales bacterium]|nr:universal stress protein [Acidimicrobiales bacterium]
DIETKVLTGDPASVLVDETERGGYDLLVVGNKGMTGASRFFLGSVPNKVSHHAPTALLIVRTT